MLSGILAIGAVWIAPTARGTFVNVSLPGASSQSEWSGLTGTQYPGYPSYVTSSAAWPAPIAATGGVTGLLLDKTSGLGFPSNGGGIYVGGLTSGTGTYRILSGDSVTLAGFETVVFQIEIEGVGAVWSSLLSGISLDYNEGSQALPPSFFTEVSAVSTGEMFGEPAMRFCLAFQWDLSGQPGDVESFRIGWTAAEHSMSSRFQINQGDTMVQAIPEPAVWVLVGLAAAALCGRAAHGRCWRRTL